jgi:GPH family glycoside/pentoside/hexuronide:cation symporter
MTHSDDKHARSAVEALRFSTKFAYGVGDFGAGFSGSIQAFYQLIFLTNVAGLSPLLAGSLRTIASIWDAINDPIVGTLSDRTQTRWGRRYPWMVLGAFPLGVFFFLQWIVPHFSATPGTQQIALFAYYTLINVVFNTSFTVVNLPYGTLTAELTRDYNERTSLNQFRFTASIVGSILALVLAQILFNTIDVPTRQYFWLALISAIIAGIAPYICTVGTYPRAMAMVRLYRDEDQAGHIPYLEQLKIVLQNRPFLYVVGIYLFSWFAVQNTAAIIPYFIQSWMRLPKQHLALIPLTLQGTAIVALSIWSIVSHRVGKKAVYFMGMSFWIIAGVGVFLLHPGQVTLMYGLAIATGFGVATAYLIPWSMLPDVIELDELKTGQRREGIFYGFMVFLQKIGLALGQFLVGVALQQSGFNGQAVVQPESALLAIRVLIGPVPILALLCGMILAYFYPISREMHAEILAQLHQRYQGDRPS